MRFKAEIEVSTRQDVLNPESKAILQSLQNLYFPILDLKLNKKFYVNIESKNEKEAIDTLEIACKELLANPIIEDYTISIESKENTKNTKSKNISIQKNKRGKAYKHEEFLDSIQDELKELKYTNNVSFGAIIKILQKKFNIKISSKTLYEYFMRKLEWKKTKGC